MPLLVVCLVSDPPIYNYLGGVLKNPDAIVWLRTYRQKNMITQVENAIKTQHSPTFENREVKENEIEEFIARCEGIIKDYPEHDIALNASGGARMQALLATEVFKKANKEVFYIDSEHSRLVDVRSGEYKTFHFTLTVNEYIALHGIDMEAGTRFDPEIGKRSSLSYFIINNCDQIVPFIDRIRPEWIDMGDNKLDREWKLEHPVARFSIQYEAPSKKMRFRFGADDRMRSMEIDTVGDNFIFNGGWLRELVFLRVHRSQYDDVRLDTRIKRETLPNGQRAESMIDIAMMKGCHFYIFQCFSYPITRESFIELSAIHTTTALLHARGFIFTAHRPHRAFLERASESNMTVISGKRIGYFSI